MNGSRISNLVSTSVTLGTGGYSSPLIVTRTGAIEPVAAGATALYAPAALGSVAVTNHGTIAGGAGALAASQGRAGGIGVDLAASAIVRNTRLIDGGNGGATYVGGTSGVGGAGIILDTGGTLTNQGTLLGGMGGGGARSALDGTIIAGAGGDGAIIAGGGNVNNSGSIGGAAAACSECSAPPFTAATAASASISRPAETSRTAARSPAEAADLAPRPGAGAPLSTSRPPACCATAASSLAVAVVPLCRWFSARAVLAVLASISQAAAPSSIAA